VPKHILQSLEQVFLLGYRNKLFLSRKKLPNRYTIFGLLSY